MNAITNFDMNDIQYLASLKGFVVTNITPVNQEVTFVLQSPKTSNVGVLVCADIQEFEDQYWTNEDNPENDRSYPMTNGRLKGVVAKVLAVEELPIVIDQIIALTFEQVKHIDEVLSEKYIARFEEV